jgi:hypothetical protein
MKLYRAALIGLSLGCSVSGPALADGIIVNFINGTSKSVNQLTQSCLGATCSAPSSIAAGTTGKINATVTGPSAQIIYRYGARYGISLNLMSCQVTASYDGSCTSTGASAIMTATDQGSGAIPSCTYLGLKEFNPSTCTYTFDVRMTQQ